MPQLDPTVFVPQIFWLIVTFAVLYLFISTTAAPKIAEILEKRQKRIEDDLAEAEKLQREAETVRDAFEKTLEERRTKAAALVLAKREQVKKEIDERYAALTVQLNNEAEDAARRIESAKQEALSDLRLVAADVCKDMVSRVAGITVDDAAVSRVVDAELGIVKEKADA